MRDKYILSKDPLDKEAVIAEIENIVKDQNYRICRSDTLDDADIDLYHDVSDEEFYLISITIFPMEEFYIDANLIDGKQYFYSMVIAYNDEIRTRSNYIIRKLFEAYPDLYVADDLGLEFYSLQDIITNNVPPWLSEQT